MDAIDRRQQLAAERVAGLVVGDDALLVVGQRAARLHPGDDPLERGVEVDHLDRSARRRAAKIAASLQMFARSAPVSPEVWRASRLKSTSVGERLVARVDLEDPLAAADVGRRDEDLAVEASGPQQRRVELLEQVRGGDHDHVLARGEAVELDQQLVERLVALAGDVEAAVAADGVELVDEHDRGRLLARRLEQAPDPGRADADEHLDERGRRLGEEGRARLVRDRLGEQRLAGARRPVQQDALRDLRADLAEALGVAQVVDDLAQLILGLVGAGDVAPRDRRRGVGLDLLRARPRHEPHQREHRRRPAAP